MAKLFRILNKVCNSFISTLEVNVSKTNENQKYNEAKLTSGEMIKPAVVNA